MRSSSHLVCSHCERAAHSSELIDTLCPDCVEYTSTFLCPNCGPFSWLEKDAKDCPFCKVFLLHLPQSSKVYYCECYHCGVPFTCSKDRVELCPECEEDYEYSELEDLFAEGEIAEKLEAVQTKINPQKNCPLCNRNRISRDAKLCNTCKESIVQENDLEVKEARTQLAKTRLKPGQRKVRFAQED